MKRRNRTKTSLLWHVGWLLSVFCLLAASAGLTQAQNGRPAWAWGYNGFGQLGDGTAFDCSTPIHVKGAEGVGDLIDIVAISSGHYHTLALRSDGTVWAYGSNGYGQLGDGTSINRSTPVQVKGSDGVGYLTNVVVVSAGDDHSLAVTSDGSVWAWGWNAHGALGDGTDTNRSTPVQVKGPNGTGYLQNVVAVAGGGGYWKVGEHSLAVKSDGTVWAWGCNVLRELGDGTGTDRYTPVQVKGPGGVGYLTDVVAVSGGYYHSLALKSNGTVWAWGYNGDDQCGDGIWPTIEYHDTPVQVVGPNGKGYLTAIVAISSGDIHNLALKSDGTVWAWGARWNGRLGYGNDDWGVVPGQVKGPDGVGFLTNIVTISAGEGHNLAVKSDGTIWAWGANGNGQCGDGANRDCPIPVQVKGPLGVGYLLNPTAIAAGGWHSSALVFTPKALFTGKVTLEESADKSVPVFFGFQPLDGEGSFFRSLTLQGDGTFSLVNLPRNLYHVWIKGTKWLAKSVVIDTRENDVSDVNVLLLAGDANNDNFVDVFDLAALIFAFDTAPNESHWDDGADLNCDGAVDVFDLDLLIRNFGSEGDF